MKPHTVASHQAIVEALQRTYLAILETIHEAGDMGAPDGVLFAAMQAHGATLAQYRQFTTSMTSRGFVILDANCYTLTEAGATFMTELKVLVDNKAASRPPTDQSPDHAQ